MLADESAQNAVQQGMSNDDAPAPASNGTNSTQRKNAAKTETVPKQNNRIVAHGEARSRARSSEKRISRNQSGGVSTNEAQSRLRNVVNGDAPYPVRSTRCTSNERIPSEKKRRRSAVHDTNEQTENPRIKRSKSSQRSDDGSAVARNSQNKSPPNHSKSSAATPKPQRNRRLNDSVLSSNGQGTILKYLSKPACSKCGAVVKTLPESRFHEKCHAQKQCTVCKKPVRTNDVKNHLYTCLLMCGKLTTNEMLPYMTRVSVKVLKTESARTEIDNTDNAANAIVSGDGSDRDSDIVRRAKRVIRPITIDSSSEEEIKGKFGTTLSANSKKNKIEIIVLCMRYISLVLFRLCHPSFHTLIATETNCPFFGLTKKAFGLCHILTSCRTMSYQMYVCVDRHTGNTENAVAYVRT